MVQKERVVEKREEREPRQKGIEGRNRKERGK